MEQSGESGFLAHVCRDNDGAWGLVWLKPVSTTQVLLSRSSNGKDARQVSLHFMRGGARDPLTLVGPLGYPTSGKLPPEVLEEVSAFGAMADWLETEARAAITPLPSKREHTFRVEQQFSAEMDADEVTEKIAQAIKGPAEDDIRAMCAELCEMLVMKNRAYGNSALEPVRVFSTASTEEQIRVRLDDKLSRLKKGQAQGEDVLKDLVGYLVLLLIAERRAGKR